MSLPLSRIVAWSHQLLAEVLELGDTAVDLTAGNGYDTLMLARQVGCSGPVLAFDLQSQALENTADRLAKEDIPVTFDKAPTESLSAGVHLVLGSHAGLDSWRGLQPKAIIANLGYLPGGDKDLVTRPESTLAALRAGCRMLQPGGRIAVVVYTAHPGGQSEAEAVETFFRVLSDSEFEVLRLEVANRPQAPYLLVAGKLNR